MKLQIPAVSAVRYSDTRPQIFGTQQRIEWFLLIVSVARSEQWCLISLNAIILIARVV